MAETKGARSGSTGGMVESTGTGGSTAKASRTKLDLWCDRAWIKFSIVLAFVMMVAILVNWNTWSDGLKVIAGIAVLIPNHVIEEWVFPGGFHYQYNVMMYKSDRPNCYPMCRCSDMITNLVTTLLFVGLTIWCAATGEVPEGMLMAVVAFSALEFFMHTAFGAFMYFKFRDRGKTTIYGPGSVTAYFGFVPLGAIAFLSLQGATITGTDWAICIGILLFIAVCTILIPETLIKKHGEKYPFADAGYYQRFLD